MLGNILNLIFQIIVFVKHSKYHDYSSVDNEVITIKQLRNTRLHWQGSTWLQLITPKLGQCEYGIRDRLN